MKREFTFADVASLVSEEIIPRLPHYRIITFTGPLGAGKTTLIKEILRQCGVTDVVTSPTFGYVNSYTGKQDKVFNHFDLYRILTIDDFMAAGLDEHLYRQEVYNFIEWPKIIAPLLESDDLVGHVWHIQVTYSLENLQMRVIKL